MSDAPHFVTPHDMRSYPAPDAADPAPDATALDASACAVSPRWACGIDPAGTRHVTQDGAAPACAGKCPARTDTCPQPRRSLAMTSPPSAPAKHARDMTDAEFAEACRTKEWRNAIATKPPTQIAPAETRPPDRRDSSTSTTSPPSQPAAPAMKHPRDMTDAEFAEACAEHAWRRGMPSR